MDPNTRATYYTVIYSIVHCLHDGEGTGVSAESNPKGMKKIINI